VQSLKNFWYIAAASHELRRRPIRREVEGDTLVLFRDSGGRPHALTDRCAHRGMALSSGRVVGDCIQCPYHGWQYDGQAVLRNVPALCSGEMPPVVRSVRSYPVVEQQRQLWVWLGEGQPDRGPFGFPRYGEPRWSTFFMHTRFEAPVEACLENFLDVPHTIFVHPGLFRSGTSRPTQAVVRRYPDSAEAEFISEQPLSGLGPRLFFPRGTMMRHTDRFILPSITRVDYSFGDKHGFIITSQCTQRAERLVDVTTAITWRLPMPRWIVRPFARWYCRRVIRQDVRVLKVLGEQQERFGPCRLNTSADLLGGHIRVLRRRTAGESCRDGDVIEACEETVLQI
jgi:phenylpropionate dioxygenase-like ring-hydroxylating dioxygenase large terminal subunit